MKDHTEIVAVLDASGSMAGIIDDSIGGFNSFVEAQKVVGDNASVSLVLFDHEYMPQYSGTPITEVKELTSDTYVPRGMTALLDALGRTINETGQRLAALDEDDRPNKVIFVILTDGFENASHEFRADQIKKLITEQTDKYKWDFVYLGANQDAFAVGAGLGISAGSTFTYDSTSVGTRSAYATASNLVAAARVN